MVFVYVGGLLCWVSKDMLWLLVLVAFVFVWNISLGELLLIPVPDLVLCSVWYYFCADDRR